MNNSSFCLQRPPWSGWDRYRVGVERKPEQRSPRLGIKGHAQFFFFRHWHTHVAWNWRDNMKEDPHMGEVRLHKKSATDEQRTGRRSTLIFTHIKGPTPEGGWVRWWGCWSDAMDTKNKGKNVSRSVFSQSWKLPENSALCYNIITLMLLLLVLTIFASQKKQLII